MLWFCDCPYVSLPLSPMFNWYLGLLLWRNHSKSTDINIILYNFIYFYFWIFFFLCWGMNWGLVHARPGQIRSFPLGTIHEGFSTGKSGYIVQPTIHYTLFLMPVKIGSQDHFSRNLALWLTLYWANMTENYIIFFYSEMKQSWK